MKCDFRYFATFFIFWILSINLWCAWLNDIPSTVTQPDGTVLECLASGDEFHNWLHDNDGYTIIQHPKTGYFVYAEKQGKELVAGNAIAGKDNPAAYGLVPHLNISNEHYSAKRRLLFDGEHERNSSTTGTLNNIIIYIRFSDQDEYTSQTADEDLMYNSTTTSIASMRNYFWEESYQSLDVISHFLPTQNQATIVSYQHNQPRSYFLQYNEESNPNGLTDDNFFQRRAELFGGAIAYVNPMLPSGVDFDANDDGEIDNVIFMIRGSHEGCGKFLWPHKSSLHASGLYLGGILVTRYNLGLEYISGVSVACHEFTHTLGAPDYYHYSEESIFEPVGLWDVMSHNQNPPQHTSAFTKWKYLGWIADIPIISPNQTYTLNPLNHPTPTNVAYRIISPNTPNEYLLVEYRRNYGLFESSLPNKGLLVWRVKTDCGNGNADGPPDEFYVYRPTSSPTSTGQLNNAYMSAQSNRTAINNTTNPYPFLSDGSPSGVCIQNIGQSSDTISFFYGDPFVDFSTNPISISFDHEAFPPDGYQSVAINGSIEFEHLTEGEYPICSSHAGSGMMGYHCRNNSTGSAFISTSRLEIQNQADALYSVNFWMHRDEAYLERADRIEIYRNGLPNLNGSPVLLGTVHRSTALSPAVSTSGWHQYSFLINPPTNGTYYVVIKAISANGNNIYLDDLILERHNKAVVSAVSPADNATGISTSTSLSWSNSSRYISHIKLNFGSNYPPTNVLDGEELPLGSTSWTNPNILLSDTCYYWQVVTYDEYGKAYQAPIFSFRTEATEPLTGISFYEGFEIPDVYTLPIGWKSINANGDDREWHCMYGVPHSGDKYIAVGMETLVQGDDWVISRGITLNADTQYILSFYYRRYGQSYSTKYAAYFSTSDDPGDPKETILIDENVTNANYNYYEMYINPPTSGVYYFMFHSYGGPFSWSPSGIAIDDFLLRGISTAIIGEPFPAEDSFAVPLDTAFSWEIQSGTPTGYLLSLGTDNPPTNLYYRVDIGNTLSWTPPQNLEHDKRYYWSVAPYDNYGEAIDTPVWSFYSMLNNVISVLPYSENFDTSDAGLLPDNWTQFDLDADGKKWKVVSETGAYSAPKCLKIERNTVPGETNNDWAISPPVTLYAGFNYEISFQIRNSLLTYPGKLRIAIGEVPDPDQLNTIIYDNETVNNTIWSQKSCSINPAVTGNYYIGFNCYSPSGQHGFNMYLDDIQLVTSSIALPVNSPSPADNAEGVFINSTTLTWENTGDVLGYRISIGTDNPPTNLINNLDIGNQKYYVHEDIWPFGETIYWQVIPYNSVGISVDNPLYSFSIMPEVWIDILPYNEDYESISTPNLPAGYLCYNTNQDEQSWISRNTTAPFVARVLSMDRSDVIADDWLFLPGVSVQAGTCYVISFSYRNDRNRTAAKLALYRGNQPVPDAMNDQLFYNDGIVSTSFWNEAELRFISSETGVMYFGFHCFTSAEGGRINIDNLEILGLPTPVSDPIPANNSLGISLRPVFSWEYADGNPQGYRFYLGTDDPPTNICNGLELGITNEMYYLESLLFSTVYYWKVVPYNSMGDAPECPAYCFTTMDQNTLTEFPYSQNFDDYTAPQLPYDWFSINNNEDPARWSSSSLSSRSEPNSVRLGSNFIYDSFDDWLFSPAISLTKGLQYRISFHVRQAGTRKTDDLFVYLGRERLADEMTTQILQTTVSSSQDADFTLRQVDFSSTSSGAFYIGLHGLDDSPGTIFLDDFSIQQISSSLKPPQQLSALATAQSITLSWLNPSLGTPHQFKLFRNGILHATIPWGENNYIDEDLVLGQEYLYFVTAEYLDPEGESVESNHIYASLLPSNPQSPQDLSLQVTEADISLSWQAVVEDENGNPINVSTYRIYASDHPDFEPGPLNLISSTSLTSYTFNPTQSRMFFKIIAVKEP
ncbi:MAG: choice-of-anchor J domain-containing protein [Candidatus Cloacimonetes bacterium]|jgi:M6 family metalloprotease-like protein|nr:choice-of-anchor J domain-containing protein [Candidatus Cloacimonadota bacterium]MDY0337933.1 choice-of-anchor J domain-containing protein [Candidatus Cloacimonadaceae bacterium]MCB5269729.1 choice-of-anchor J domain-containing protein [Candidatus Cloacimonadota bacterium]MDD2544388.1 choice-of-anchor J domain-containing protein [Candidatus Cloacimonadota bacterium]MDD2683334.1 choice-of-anchor J domain-containing protein [Candidatus Cloacimonadota bacterium]